jgi:hypothetical protein
MSPVYIRNAEEKAAAEEIIGKETTQMYRSPEMIDLYMRDVLTEKSDIWVSRMPSHSTSRKSSLKGLNAM